MIGPWLDPPVLLAIPIGLLFGWLLERSGLASARTIADQLAFRDFTVVKVMFAAIVTAMLGVFWAARLGWLDLANVGIPSTDIVPQLAGAVVFGAGFALASLCPGTACAAIGTGRGDGLAVVGGLFVGTLGISLAWPGLGPIAVRADREGALLPDDLGVPAGVVVAFVAVGAVVLLPWLSRFEGGATRRLPIGLATGAMVLGLLAIPASLTGGAIVGGDGSAAVERVDPLDLAEWIRHGRDDVRVIDVRGDVGPTDYVIPGAEQIPLAALGRHAGSFTGPVVLYGDDEAQTLDGWAILRDQGIGSVAILDDGLAGWDAAVMSPMPAIPGDRADSLRFARARELSAWFGGMPRSAREADAEPVRRRRNRC